MPYVRRSVPAWFRLVAVLLLLWGAMGAWSCIQQIRLGAAAMGPASAYDRALYAALPGWYNAVYGICVGSGLLGSAALIARLEAARPLYVLSLVGIVVMFGWMFLATDIIAVKGIATACGFPALILGIGLAQLWLATHVRRRGWIG